MPATPQKAQKIFSRLNNIEEAHQNDFVVQSPDFDQQSVSNESEANSINGSVSANSYSSASGSSVSSGSSQRFANNISVIQEQFLGIFDRIINANNYSLDQMCTIVSVDIIRLGMGVIGKDTIKGFYRGKI
ncbi:hypothetical protein C1646_766178 [Rhizophagus diaphanus]|nr:hypothetical protein C1646_766178 [Rhizophagus diaphanus] [Rhizophagus sp. MUCL 43196]